MNFVRLLPAIFSSLIMYAHFSRAGQNEIAIVCLLLLGLLFIKKQWVARLFQVLLVAGMFVWIHTIIQFVQMRQAGDKPWLRLAIILGAVALFTGLSALVFEGKALKKRYAK